MILLKKMLNQGYPYDLYKKLKIKTLKRIKKEKTSEKQEKQFPNVLTLTYNNNTEKIKELFKTTWKNAEKETKNLEESIPVDWDF